MVWFYLLHKMILSFANIETGIGIVIGNTTSSLPSDLQPPKLRGW